MDGGRVPTLKCTKNGWDEEGQQAELSGVRRFEDVEIIAT